MHPNEHEWAGGRSVTYCSKLATEEAREVAEAVSGLDPDPGFHAVVLAYRVAEAVNILGLKHAVITSVNRDELPDGGAAIWAATIRQVKALNPHCTVEALIPDFEGVEASLLAVLEAKPDILAHNTETVPRLYRTVRPQAKYPRSLELLQRAKQRGFVTKSGVMVGLGEEWEELRQVMHDLCAVRCDILTIGQYLQPSRRHLPVLRIYTPEEFQQLRQDGLTSGFRHVEAGPLVRSSYHAEQQADHR